MTSPERRPPVCLHVGLPKAGSTSLQKDLFSRLGGIRYHALTRKGGSHAPGSTFDRLVRCVREGGGPRPDIEGYADWFAGELAQDTRLHLVSEERFTGIYGMGLSAKPAFLANVFGSARILIMVRKPAALMASQYFQQRRMPRYALAPVGRYRSWVDAALDHPDHHLSPAQYLRVDLIADAFADAFGREKVTIVPIELANHDQRRFNELIADAVGIAPDSVDDALPEGLGRKNARPRSVSDLAGSRSMTGLLRDAAAAFSGGYADDEAAERIGAFAAPIVDRLEAEWNLPLRALGY